MSATDHEKNILAALAMKPAFLEAFDVRASDFADPRARETFGVIASIWDESRPETIEAASLAAKLGGNGAGAFVAGLLDGQYPRSRESFALVARELVDKKLRADIVKAGQSGDFEKLREALDRHDAAGSRRGTEPVTLNLDAVQAEAVRWLWPGWLPSSKLSLLAGDGGVGKSYLAAELAARISTGRPAPDGQELESGSVLFLLGEDSPADTLRPRLDLLQGDASKVRVLDGVQTAGVRDRVSLPEHLDALDKAASQIPDLRLVVVDPLAAFTSHKLRNLDKGEEARYVLDPLADFAARRSVSVLVILHLNKSTLTSSALYRIAGSVQLGNAPRSVMLLAPHPEHAPRRLLASGKMNLCRKPDPLSFDITDAGLVDFKVEPKGPDADEALQAQADRPGRSVELASDFLRRFLADGPRLAADAFHEAGENGISSITLKRAKPLVHVLSTKGEDGRWTWLLE